jgi:hypothetical protein
MISLDFRFICDMLVWFKFSMFSNDIEQTNYGYKRAGKSRFVIIAPHAAGDDWKTARAARVLAEKMSASLVVNDKYFKETNGSFAGRPQEFACDFNRLCWSQKLGKYLWKRKPSDMKLFYKDIAAYCHEARIFSAEEKAVAVYVHGMRDKEIGVDLGVGLRAKNDGNKFINQWERPENNSGVITIRISQLKKLKAALQKKLKTDYNLTVSVGRKYIGWSSRSAIQFHKHEGRSDFALQIEINRRLRRLKNIGAIAELLGETLSEVFI